MEATLEFYQKWQDLVFILGKYFWFILEDTLWLREEWKPPGQLLHSLSEKGWYIVWK